jgi:pyridoxal phosphate enzyme (YggS family)
LVGVRLVVVSKTHPAEAVLPLLAAGQRLFGESRVQEAVGKWTALKAAHPDVELHMIGPLQTNKVREAVTLFDAIHGVDRAKLARSLAHEMARQGRRPRCLIQVNTGREAQKAGIDPDQADRFIAACRDDFGLPVAGVMCIPPADADPEPHFRLLAAIAERHGLEMISMGMSGDFEQAIAAGATHVRVGSAILGER